MNFLIPDRWAALAAQYPERTVGRITLQEKGMYRIRTGMGEQNALVSGKFQFDAQAPSDYPAVGDYVMVNCADPDTAIIHQVLPRKSLFVRKAAGTSKEPLNNSLCPVPTQCISRYLHLAKVI